MTNSHQRHSGALAPNSGLPEFGIFGCPSRQQPTWMASEPEISRHNVEIPDRTAPRSVRNDER
jgi:hypothetical protein